MKNVLFPTMALAAALAGGLACSSGNPPPAAAS
jgi:hypothetical protein